MINLPSTFLDEMKEILGSEYDAFLKSYDDSVKRGIRLNRKKIDADSWKMKDPFDCVPVPWIDNGYFHKDGLTPSKHPYYFAGLYYLQEASAMTPANRLPVAPSDKVLDLCSAPGGKATEILSRLSEEGLLVANDISATRAKGLLKNIELFGAARAVVTSAAPDALVGTFEEYFDKILIDAPCSGEGMFRKNPGMVSDWEMYGPDYYADMQRTILPAAYKMLKPGGMMMYSTCTFSVKEDEANVEWLLDQYPDLSLADIEGFDGFVNGLTDRTRKCVRIFPHKMPGEGHFMAMFQKEARADFSPRIIQRRKARVSKELKELEKTDLFNFLDECGLGAIDRDYLAFTNGYVSYLKEDIDIPSEIRILRKGLLLGQIKNQKFIPSQALALALHADKCKKALHFELSDERVIRYLKGETIEADIERKGFVLVCVDGFPLGWAKAEGTRLKNKYLPGWRWQSVVR